MTLLAPFFAWLLPLALLPVAFHLFFRIRKQPRAFPSLLFFLAADPRHSARRRLRDWLVLLLRTLALAALLFALARPMRPGWGGGETRVFLVVDNSASMLAADAAGQTRLSRALAAATAVVQDRSVRQAAVLTTVRDPALALPAGLSDDLSAVRTALAAVRPTHASGDVAGVLRQAAGLTRGVMRGAAEVHIFTDLQAGEWAAAQAPVDFPRGVAVAVHLVGRESDRMGTVALLPPPPARRPVAGRPWRLDVAVRNYGSRECEAVVNVAIGEIRLRQSAAVGGNQTRQVRLLPPGLPAGDHPVRVWLDGPSAGPSAEAWQVVRVAPPDDVWLIGEAADYGMLGFALAPAEQGLLTGLRVDSMSAARLAATQPPRPPVLVVATFQALADARVSAFCRDYAAAGGTLLLCPAPVDVGAVPGLPEWCGVGAGALHGADKGAPLTVFDADAALWDELRDDRGRVALKGVDLHRWFALETKPREGATALAGTPDGQAALTRTVLGRGVVYVAGFAWDTRWSNLPRRAVFLPLALGFARPVHAEEAAALAVVAGAVFPSERRVPAGGSVRLRTVAGDVVEWSGRADAVATPARAGVFRVEGLSPPLTLSVAGAPGETAPELVREPPVLAGVDYRRLVYSSAMESAGDVQQARRGQSLFGPFLALAAVFWLLELWLVNLRPVKPLQGHP